MSMHVCENLREVETSATLAIAARCKALRDAGRDIIDLGAGEPDFRTPDFAAQAGIAAIVQGFTHYTPVAGMTPLRQAIADYLGTRSGRQLEAGGVVVTAGAKQALFNAFFVLFGPGDEALLPAPYWTSYPPLLRLARAQPVIVPTSLDDGFKIDTDRLETARTPRTRGIILNSPSNPTGVMYTPAELAEIVAWAARHDLWIISDEIYGRITYDAERAPSLLDLADVALDRIVIIDGASKAFAMTGWRLGYSYSPPHIAALMTTLQSQTTSNASTPAQFAALATLRDEPRVQHAVRAMVGVFRHRREKVVEALRRHLPHAEFVEPSGAFYVFVRVDPFFAPGRADSVELCAWLLEETGVALVPGSAFGDDAFVRLSFAAPQAELHEAIRRIGEALTHAESASLASR
jgi:aspartate aminotransferase